jgi:hypothetical protein
VATVYEADMADAKQPSDGSGGSRQRLPPLPSEWVQAMLARSLQLIDAYDPADLLVLQLRSVAGLG